jgi:hypothetical protein
MTEKWKKERRTNRTQQDATTKTGEDEVAKNMISRRARKDAERSERGKTGGVSAPPREISLFVFGCSLWSL